MEKYIILINCEGYCIDLHSKFSYVENIYTVEITGPFDLTFVITKDDRREGYIEAAKYVLDKRRIVSIIPLFEKHTHYFFHFYIRMNR